MSPFQPSGETARWRIIYDLLAEVEVGEVLDYVTMANALELNHTKDRHVIQVAMRRAAAQLERVEKHAVEAVNNVGYRVVQAEEHLRLARKYQAKSSKALALGQSKVINVDLSNVDPEVRQAFAVVASAFAMQVDFNRRTDIRQQRLEESLESMRIQSTRTEEEVSELRARLDRLERRS